MYHKRMERQNDESTDCAICLDPLTPDNTIQTACYHEYHYSCLIQYAVSCASRNQVMLCPVCRYNLSVPLHMYNARAHIIEHPRTNNGRKQLILSFALLFVICILIIVSFVVAKYYTIF